MKFVFRLSEMKTPFYTVITDPNNRKSILFTLNPENKSAEVDVSQITYHALDMLLLGLKGGYITVDKPIEFQKFVDRVREKLIPKQQIKEEVGDANNDTVSSEEDDIMSLSVAKFKEFIENHLLTTKDNKETVIKYLEDLKSKEEVNEDPRSSVIKFINSKIENIKEGYYSNIK